MKGSVMSSKEEKTICNRETMVFSRVCGYFRPVSQWNKGKQQEFSERKVFDHNTLSVR